MDGNREMKLWYEESCLYSVMLQSQKRENYVIGCINSEYM